MQPADLNLSFDHWTTEQKLEMIGRIWDSIPAETPPVPQWHLDELKRRMEAHAANPERRYPLEEVMVELRSRQ